MSKIYCHKIMIFLGKLSFSIYIFHFFVLDIIRTVLLSFNFEQIWLTLYYCFQYSPLRRFDKLDRIYQQRIIEDPAITYGHKLSQSLP